MFMNTKKQGIILGTALAMTIMFVFCAYIPLKIKIERLDNQIVQVNDDKQLLRVCVEQLPALRSRVEQLGQIAGHFENLVPDKRKLGDFLNSIAKQMEYCHLTEQLVEPSQEIVEGSLYCIPVEFSAKGSLENMFEFFSSLKSIDRLIRIEQVDFTGSNEFDGEVEMKTKGLIYYQPPIS